MKWDIISTPNSIPDQNDILNPEDPTTIGGPWGSEIQSLAVAGNNSNLAAVVRTLYQDKANSQNVVSNVLYVSSSQGIKFSLTRQTSLDRTTNWFTAPFTPATRRNLYQVAIAQDNPNFIAVTSDDISGGPGGGPRCVWATTDGGSNWDQIMPDSFLAAGETIRSIDISTDYNGKRDIAVATYTGGFGGQLYVKSSGGLQEWKKQDLLPAATVDFQAIKFSPSYNSDSSIAAVYCSGSATYFNISLRDLSQNTTPAWVYASPGIEVKDPSSASDASPDTNTLNKADLQLPGDFSGQSASLRRAYISLDSAVKNSLNQSGIFRIDDSTVYRLMDTTTVTDKNIYSIAYYGTYASGKLLAGERNGFPCSATVPSWFTDSPTTCPIPCWYPALKPTTGAANQGLCSNGIQSGTGAALVAWDASGALGLIATSSNAVTVAATWYQPWLSTPIPNDESAFAISRNNGETWNQLSLIDTTIDWFNDVVPSPDGTTLYVASVNRYTGENQTIGLCNQFDSVWRSTVNMTVASPLPAINPIGQYWERVFTHVTSMNCSQAQTDLPILRVPTGCNDKPDGQIVAWAAQYSRAQAWSPDFGDFWAVITPRDIIQDFCFESSTIMYDLSPMGLVQKLPYTGTTWSTQLLSVDTTLSAAHSIAAFPDGHVLVGASSNGRDYVVAYSPNMQTASPTFRRINGESTMGDVHVAFDPDFTGNQLFYNWSRPQMKQPAQCTAMPPQES